MWFSRRRLLSVRHSFHKLQTTRFNSSLTSDLFFPTTGRWPWNERRKRQEHTQKFDLRALEHVIIKAAGSTAGITVRFEKLAEGASNKVFLAVVGERRLIVKIPDPVDPRCLVTASEVATLEFLRSELEVPVPKVFSWSDNSDNPVGCEYIIMEEAQGRALNTVWSHLEIPEKLAIVDEVLSIQRRLVATKPMFSVYGSLYFLDDAAKLGFSRHFSVISTSTPTYCIGPLAHQHFIEPALTASGVNCGPYLHFGNLFVSPEGKITCIVNWQGTDILPLFLAVRMPQFIDVERDALLLELPENFSAMPEAKRLELWERYRQSMLQQYYLADLRKSAPDLAAVLEDEELSPIRKQVEVFARIPFRQDVEALLLRETLLRIQRHLSGFLRDGNDAEQCPIKIEGDELTKHQKDGRRYNEFQDLLKARNIPVAEEGWVPSDEFTERKDNLKSVIEETVESLESEQERLEFNDRLRHWNLTDWETT
ncbi:hypothetical protein PV08_06878 [Exophiala spinifera]|uniref:Aminoglycoside phosphotransferase domain-containing protein n=1 Tax=Exophiala spinifera TaxID=91928 RepID=A0A0D1ZMQ3_9EURO|nr:uncharacterized protein PV08_06878 [Exophiala spinifera]KIW14097.1 hypothetical protein PV08_06878 [Exophiala spinifera]